MRADVEATGTSGEEVGKVVEPAQNKGRNRAGTLRSVVHESRAGRPARRRRNHEHDDPRAPSVLRRRPQADLDDLRERLERTSFAPAAPGDSWEYGTPESYLRDMVRRWTTFDWRAVEDRVNAYPGFRTEIDGQPIHYLHVRSQHEDATPLLLAHTYPGSILDFLD